MTADELKILLADTIIQVNDFKKAYTDLAQKHKAVEDENAELKTLNKELEAQKADYIKELEQLKTTKTHKKK